MSKKTDTEIFSKKLVGKSVNGKSLCATECGFKKIKPSMRVVILLMCAPLFLQKEAS